PATQAAGVLGTLGGVAGPGGADVLLTSGELCSRAVAGKAMCRFATFSGADHGAPYGEETSHLRYAREAVKVVVVCDAVKTGTRRQVVQRQENEKCKQRFRSGSYLRLWLFLRSWSSSEF